MKLHTFDDVLAAERGFNTMLGWARHGKLWMVHLTHVHSPLPHRIEQGKPATALRNGALS